MKNTLTSVSLIVLAVLFVALVILSDTFFKGARIDLTENQLYTLSDGTKNILANIDEPLNLYFFFSDQASRSIPTLRTYAARVREMLDEFVLRSNGQIKLQVIDPVPFSEAEDTANQFGLQAIPVGNSGSAIYFGLAGTNSVDGVETIRFFQPEKEPFLEYDMTKLVYNLANPKKSVIGLLSTLPLNGGFDPMSRQPRQPWVINEHMNQLFTIRPLGADLTSIDEDIDVLMLVHPKNLSEQTLYAIDQFIVGGGKAMIFVDPHAEAEIPTGGSQAAVMFAERSSELSKLLAAWGLEVDTTQIVGDARYALAVNIDPSKPPVRHVGIISLDQNSLSGDDIVTADLNSINLSLIGHIEKTADSPVDLVPLIQSSDQAMLIGADKVRFLPDPGELLKEFKPSGERYTIAARVSGKVKSAFPDGAPAADAETDQAEEIPHITESAENINVILVADTDILTDRLWVRVSNFFGQQVASAWANNGDFITNALDNLLGNKDLIGMRSRATSNRPFTAVQELEREANEKFRAKEQELVARLQETEQKLNALQQGREDTQNQEGLLILSPEQQAEIERFQQNKLEIRKELRQVRLNLNDEVQKLGSWLKFINIGLIPIVIGVLALIVMGFLRARRRSAAA